MHIQQRGIGTGRNHAADLDWDFFGGPQVSPGEKPVVRVGGKVKVAENRRFENPSRAFDSLSLPTSFGQL